MNSDALVIHMQSRPEPFGFCYECKDGMHCLCVGVPCGCPCPFVAPAQPEVPSV